MTAGGRGRRVVLIASAIGAALFIGAGFLLWRLLPARALEGVVGQADTRAEYVPPDELPAALPEARLDGIDVAVIDIPENAITTSPGYYASEVARWRDWLGAAGATFTTPAEADVLVLPHGECLGAGARRLIAEHLQRGRGIVSTGALGSRDGFCAAATDTVLSALVGGGAEQATYAWPVAGNAHMVILGETMIGAGVPAGARVDLDPAPHVVFRGPQRAVFYATFERQPVAVEGEEFFDGAIARSIVGGGRVVAFGFGLAEVTHGWSEQIMRLVVQNAVTWAAGLPVIQLASWPDGHSAAAVVAQDVEADYANAAGAVRLLVREAIPTTYFIVGSLAESHPWLTRSMAENGEIASHSYHHRPMDTFSDAGQVEELGLSKRTAEEFEAPVLGFRPPQERFNMATLEAWSAVGGEYVFASDYARSAAPVVVPMGDDSLVFLGRVIHDDFSLLSRDSVRDRSEMVRTLIQEIEEVVAYRGAYLFSYHSHIMAQEQLLPVLEAVVKALKARPDIWLATAGDVASWWRTRAAVDVRLTEGGAAAVVMNRGRREFVGGALLVDLPDGRQRRVDVPVVPPGEAVEVRW